MSVIENERLLVDYLDAGAQLSVGRTTVYDLVKAGQLCSVKIGRRSLITRASLEAYVDRLTEAGEPVAS